MNRKSGRDRPRIAVIGGGITGLSCAYKLLQQAPEAEIVLFESERRVGGKVRTEHYTDEEGRSFLLEAGADAFLSRQKPWAYELALELGLEEEILPTLPGGGIYLVGDGRLVPLPAGMRLIIPTDWNAFAASPLFDPATIERVAQERRIKPQHIDGDISVADFVRHRLGDAMVERVAEPLLSGIYSAHPEEQSLLATFPGFARMVAQDGSLLQSVEKGQSRSTSSDEAAGIADVTPFISFRNGTETLPRSLAERLGVRLRLGAYVHSLRQRGPKLEIGTASGKSDLFDRVALTLPASACAKLLQDDFPEASKCAAALRTVSTGVAWFAYPREMVPHPLDAYGLVVPRREGRDLNAITFTTSKFSGRAPDGWVLLRVFFGGARSPHMMELDNLEVESYLRRELTDLLGIDVRPHLCRVYRWRNAQPQYDVGHLFRVEALRAELPSNLVVAGTAFGGVGIPDCVRQGSEAAHALLQ